MTNIFPDYSTKLNTSDWSPQPTPIQPEVPHDESQPILLSTGIPREAFLTEPLYDEPFQLPPPRLGVPSQHPVVLPSFAEVSKSLLGSSYMPRGLTALYRPSSESKSSLPPNHTTVQPPFGGPGFSSPGLYSVPPYNWPWVWSKVVQVSDMQAGLAPFGHQHDRQLPALYPEEIEFKQVGGPYELGFLASTPPNFLVLEDGEEQVFRSLEERYPSVFIILYWAAYDIMSEFTFIEVKLRLDGKPVTRRILALSILFGVREWHRATTDGQTECKCVRRDLMFHPSKRTSLFDLKICSIRRAKGLERAYYLLLSHKIS